MRLLEDSNTLRSNSKANLIVKSMAIGYFIVNSYYVEKLL